MKTSKTSKSSVNQPITESNSNPVAVAFYRVSTQKQDNERQISDVQKYCQAFGWNLVKEFQETISGASQLNQRKELQLLLKYVEENKPNYIICSELSRLARSQDAVNIIRDWTDKGICFISLKENIKTLDVNGNKSAMTDLLLNIMTAINIFELESIKYRVKSGLKKTISTGTWSGGHIPYGYDMINQKLVINNESENVKFMFQKYSEGWGTNKIASHLRINNIRTKLGKEFTDTKVYKILSNPLYKGDRKWNDEIYKQPELRIIDDSTFTAVQNRLTNNLNTTELNKHNKYDYLLTNKIRCACGKNFVGQGRHNIYMCKSKKYGGGECKIKSVRIDWIDEEIKKRLMVNSGKLLFDNSGIINKTKELQDEIKHLQSKIDDEKETQNYYINNIRKMGQKNFDKKFDASTELVNQLQKEIDVLNIKLSQTNMFIKTPPAIGIIDPKREKEILSSKDNVFEMDIFSKVIIDKELIKKVIDKIDIDNDIIKVSLINGKTFNINRK